MQVSTITVISHINFDFSEKRLKPILIICLAPHLGHLYSAVVADTIQRFEKLVDPDCEVIFSTGK